MENQPITNPSDISSTDPTSVNQLPISPQTKTNLMMLVLVILLVSAVLFGFGGYYLGKQYPVNQAQNIFNQNQTEVTPSVISSPTSVTSSPTSSPSSVNEKVSYTSSKYGFSVQFPQSFTTQVLAAGAGIREAPPNASNFYIYKIGDTESYINRYINFEVLGLEPSYPTQWTRTPVLMGGMTSTKLVDSSKTSNFDIYLVKLNNNQGVMEIYVSNATDKSGVASEILTSLKFTN